MIRHVRIALPVARKVIHAPIHPVLAVGPMRARVHTRPRLVQHLILALPVARQIMYVILLILTIGPMYAKMLMKPRLAQHHGLCVVRQAMDAHPLPPLILGIVPARAIIPMLVVQKRDIRVMQITPHTASLAIQPMHTTTVMPV